MNDDKKLEAFKIRDTQKPMVVKPGASRSEDNESEPAPQNTSLGFERLEGILDANDAISVSTRLTEVIKTLEDLSNRVSTNKDKLAAKKAIVAIERTVDLLEYLFKTKSELEKQLNSEGQIS